MFKTITTVVATLAVSGITCADDAVQWTEADGGNGHWYQAVLEVDPLDWLEARQIAEDQGGHLATLSSGPENEWVKYQLANDTSLWGYDQNGCLCLGPYIGAMRDAGGPWTWIDGSEWSFTDWHPNTPNIDVAVPAAVRFWDVTGSFNGYAWNDRYLEEDEYQSSSYIIEWSADCNGDGIVDYGQILDGSLADTDGNGVPDCCDADITCGAIQWKIEDGGNGHWYKVIDPGPGIAWTQAALMAENLGGHLATLTSEDESGFILLILDPVRTRIGGYQDTDAPDYSEPGGGWRWVTGEPWGYTNWDTNEPNDTNGGLEDYLEIDGGSGIPGGWNDLLDLYGGHDAFLVEWSADCNDDGIVDYGQILDGSLSDENGNGVPDCCDDASCLPPIQWEVENGGNGRWYQPFTIEGSWSAARLAAESTGGVLASVTSAEKADMLTGMMGSWTWAYVGGLKVEDEWTWLNGDEWDYANWVPGNPGSDPAEIALELRHLGDINDISPNQVYESPYLAIIEWSTDCNDDGLVDYGQILDGSLVDEDGNGIPDTCECVADVTDDGVVDVTDILVIIGAWGSDWAQADVNGDGIVGVIDLLIALDEWGFCP